MQLAASPLRPAAGPELWLPRLLLAIGVVSAACGGLVGLTEPWTADPERGLQATVFTADWVHWHLQYGFGVTLGASMMHVSPGDPPIPVVNWHHPPGHTLWLTLFAMWLGNEPWVLKSAHMLLFLPSVVALYRLVGRHSDRWLGGVAAALYGTCPYAVYFGAMVLMDGVTLSLAIVTAWVFQRHLDEPDRVRWWWPGLLFFACGANDIPGYFIGATLFGLALTHRPRWPAMRAVFGMFLVSLVSFATTAVHYGLFLGGPLGWIRSMLQVAGNEQRLLPSLEWARYGEQWREILGHFGVWPLASMAAVGVVAALSGSRHARRLVVVGGIVALPGVLNYLVFFAHAPNHVYWPLPAFGGLAIVATAAAALARQAWRRGGASRWGGGALVVAMLLGGGYGAIRCQTLIGEGSAELASAHRYVAAAAPLTRGCAYVLTTAATGYGRFFGDGMVLGSVRTAEHFEQALELGKDARLPIEVAFVLEKPWFGTALHRRLEQLATPLVGDQVLVFRFRLPG